MIPMEEEYYKVTFNRVIRCKKHRLSTALGDLCRDPDRFLMREHSHIVQNNFKSKIVLIRIDGTDLVIKYHNYKDSFHKFRRYFRPTRASRNWHFSKILREKGIWVPEPVACIESRIGILRGDSYFIYEYVSGMNGEEYFRKYRHSPEQAALGMDLVVELVIKIKEIGLIHGDIRMSNLIFSNDRICLLDLDDIKPHAWYQPKIIKNRDVRGLIKDIKYNIPEELQDQFLFRLSSI